MRNLLPFLACFRQEDPPPKIEIILTDSDQIIKLRSQVENLQQQIIDLRLKLDHTEYLFRCESLVNMQIIDIAREHGIDIPNRLKNRPTETATSQTPQE